ncbi:MAG: hypothetical protein LUO79_04765 [Methanomassiliicoccales archaeon]|nr:hypothetical protein [Methanomassiliicoccales archaeon]
MFIVKRMAMQEKSYRRFIIPAIEEEFVKMVKKNGRLTESRMGIKIARKSGMGNLLSMVPVAWKLMRHDRMKLFHTERMENINELRTIIAAMEAGPRVTLPAKPPVVPTGHHQEVTA